ncbi:MAG: hypothetical protein DI563_02475 [Variovorax paradoxus]|uniref:Uncharacterized protein n=1 Tax=Variovorax paradoxus TaxID=34073 RepID=A0A2W5S4U6_VARPD|nr:MAG: hypothetical protein DI563_02475 [Variovorax paradoxus]
MATKIVAAKAAPTKREGVMPVTMPPHFNCAQYKQVCETIALRVDTLYDLLRQIQGATEGVNLSWDASTKLDAAVIIATGIGAMADEAARPGGEVIGGHDHWNFGPDFGKLGKVGEEVRHG